MNGRIFPGESLAFKADRLQINRDMVALIGGRGEGKSVLLDALRRNLERPLPDEKKRFSKITCEGFSVEWTKQDGIERLSLVAESQDQVQYLHVSQHELNTIADDHVRLRLEIRKLLGIHDDEDWLDFDGSMQTVLSELKDLHEWFKVKDAHGENIHTRNYNDQIVTLNQRRIDALTVPENKAAIDQFTVANNEASETSVLLDDVRRLVLRMEEIKQEVAQRVEDLNQRLASRSIALSSPDYTKSISTLETAVAALVRNLADAESRRDLLLKSLEERGLAGDASAIFEKTGQYQSAITAARARIKEIEGREGRLRAESDRRAKLIADCLDTYQGDADEISDRFDQLKKGKDHWTPDQRALVAELLAGVEVRGEIVFNTNDFYEGLSDLLNMRRFRIAGGQTRTERLQEVFGVRDFASFKELVLGNAKVRLDADAVASLDEFAAMKDYLVRDTELDLLSYFYRRKIQARYLTVSAAIEYLGRSPDKLSSGQRGTLFLCVKLATDPFGSPFVFDQPEDDLDNEFIVTQLVPLFRRIKRYRQVIIATHNANLVVNGDAEQVLVASNVNDQISFVTGGIEDPTIRRAICRVLEGGEQAFRDREIKYGLRHVE
jgi:ABC-type lipoprotein export system ATPase subunit/cell division septum initiation protein DivIVA